MTCYKGLNRKVGLKMMWKGEQIRGLLVAIITEIKGIMNFNTLLSKIFFKYTHIEG